MFQRFCLSEMVSPGSGFLWICFAPDLVSLRKTQFDETEKTGKSAYTQTCLESAYVKTAPSSSPNLSDYKQIKYTVSMDYSCSLIRYQEKCQIDCLCLQEFAIPDNFSHFPNLKPFVVSHEIICQTPLGLIDFLYECSIFDFLYS